MRTEPNRSRIRTLTQVATLGLATAVVLWLAALGTHWPGISLRSGVVGPLLLGIWVAASVVAGTRIRAGAPSDAVRIGAGAGLLAATLCLLILGASLVEQPEAAGKAPAQGLEGLRPAVFVFVPLFILLGGVIGGIGVVIGRQLRAQDRAERDWLAALGAVVAVTFVPLLILGGTVTTTGSGMAIRGWPNSDGANMFLYPLALMAEDSGRFYEHAHRLFGSLVGLSTLMLMVLTLFGTRAAEPAGWRRGVRTLAILIFVLVCVQGYIGGVRVNEDSRFLALVHGVSAQLIFGLAVALAAALTPSFRNPAAAGAPVVDRKTKVFATGLMHSMLLQLLLGAVYRHLQHAHVLLTHAVFSIVVVVFAMLAAAQLIAVGRGTRSTLGVMLRRTGQAMLGCVLAQFALGWTAFGLRGEEQAATGDVESIVRTAHQANGALLLALAVLGFVWSRRLCRRPG